MVLNLIVRTWRTQVIFSGLGDRVSFTDVAIANLAGDTAAALTPLRIGGLPAQVAFFQRVGTRPQLALPTLLVESVLLYPVMAAFGAGLALSAGLEWLQLLKTAGTTAGRALQTILGVFVVGWLLVLIVKRAAPNRSREVGRSIRDGVALARGMRPGAALLTVPLTVLDVLTRVALLPVLAMNVPNTPPADVLALASFALLYGQVAMPTPGGAGLVEYGMLGGAAGDLGASASGITFWWRVYTVGLHMAALAPLLWWRLSSRAKGQRAAGRADPVIADAPRSDSPRDLARRDRMGSRNR